MTRCRKNKLVSKYWRGFLKWRRLTVTWLSRPKEKQLQESAVRKLKRHLLCIVRLALIVNPEMDGECIVLCKFLIAVLKSYESLNCRCVGNAMWGWGVLALLKAEITSLVVIFDDFILLNKRHKHTAPEYGNIECSSYSWYVLHTTNSLHQHRTLMTS